jgi:hypothetical protein
MRVPGKMDPPFDHGGRRRGKRIWPPKVPAVLSLAEDQPARRARINSAVMRRYFSRSFL